METTKKYVKIGDKVLWCGAWGNDAPKDAIVTHIEVDCVAKYGTSADVVDFNKLTDRSVIISLDNGHWAYGYQIKGVYKRED